MLLSFSWTDYADKPYKEFLKSQKLTGNLIDYVVHAIAMVSDTETTAKVSDIVAKVLIYYTTESFIITSLLEWIMKLFPSLGYSKQQMLLYNIAFRNAIKSAKVNKVNRSY